MRLATPVTMRSSRCPGHVVRQVNSHGRAIHPVLGPASLGLLGLGSALDVVAWSGALSWLSFYAIAAGVAIGTWCALFALLDWICFADLGESGAWGLDGVPTAVVVGVYGAAAALRLHSTWHAAGASAMALEVTGAALLANKTWIGRELAASLANRR
jgi:uncharacterized membrane protein